MDKQNRAGYSPIMLTALATLKSQDDIETVLKLFRLGDVNAKASQVWALGTADLGSPSHSLSLGCVLSPNMISLHVQGAPSLQMRLREAAVSSRSNWRRDDWNPGLSRALVLRSGLQAASDTGPSGGGRGGRGEPQPFLTRHCPISCLGNSLRSDWIRGAQMVNKQAWSPHSCSSLASPGLREPQAFQAAGRLGAGLAWGLRVFDQGSGVAGFLV